MSSSVYLLKTRRFAPLFGTQFLGAFNDNLFKNTLAVILTFYTSQWTSIDASVLVPVIGATFILPFFLFSGIAGEICDRYNKAQLARVVKAWEIFLMALATLGFWIHSFELLLMIVFGMGVHSTLFGPIKYSIIPQHMRENELITANALVESGTFAAILLGTILGGLLSVFPNGGIIAGCVATLIAILGYIFSRFIPSAPSIIPYAPISLNLPLQTLNALRLAYKNRIVFLAILAISWFWLYGALLLSQFPTLVKTILRGDESTVTLLLSLFTLGVGAGSIACEKLSAHTIRPSLIVIGAAGMALFGIDFAFAIQTFHPHIALYETLEFWRILIDLMFIGVFGGLYSVPLYTIMQSRSDAEVRSRIISANNILNALFMVAGAVFTVLLLKNGWNIPYILLAAALITAVLAIALALKIKALENNE